MAINGLNNILEKIRHQIYLKIKSVAVINLENNFKSKPWQMNTVNVTVTFENTKVWEVTTLMYSIVNVKIVYVINLLNRWYLYAV